MRARREHACGNQASDACSDEGRPGVAGLEQDQAGRLERHNVPRCDDV